MNKETDTYREIGEKLKHFRRLSGLSQDGLAAASGISIRTIQRIEKGLSSGSAFTITALASALNISTTDLLLQERPIATPDLLPPVTQTIIPANECRNPLKVLNLSAICIVLIPFSNLILPAIILRKYNNNKGVNNYGRRILSFHILWMFTTLLLMVILPSLMLLLFEPLRGSSIPLAVPIYFASVLLNVCFTIRFALALNDDMSVIERLSNIL